MRTILAILAICAVASPGAYAATRTIQFAGISGGEFSTADVSNANLYSQCQIVITNTGTTDQQVTSIEFLQYDGAALNTGTAWASPDFMVLRNRSGGATSNTDCINQTIGEGGFCFARFITNTLPVDGRYLVCSGRFTVADVDPNSPGSMVAAGSITFTQESMVLGGMLSGAYYQSGSHLQSGANLSGPTDGSGAPNSANDPLFNDWSHNMNYFCAMACFMANAAQRDYCRRACGIAPSGEGGSPDPGPGSYNIPFFTLNRGTALEPDSPSPGPSGYPTPYQYSIRTANTHWAGGMVYEMLMGPLTSVCSGNKSFFNLGGDDFTHSDGVDGHAIVKGSNSSYPPERLLCNHRHAKDDLYLRTGSTSSFAINGGSAF